MALWGITDAAASAPKFTAIASNGCIANAAYEVIAGGVGVFGVDAAESQVQRTAGKPVAQGWIYQRYGTGSLLTIAPNAGGATYVNTTVVTLSNSSAGVINATATITTNSTGGVTALTITNTGSMISNSAMLKIHVANTTAAANSSNANTSGGSGLTLTLTFDGQAGRLHRETLVALTAAPTNDSDDAQFADT